MSNWRYYNHGTAGTLTVTGTTLTNLPESKSATGTAFYQTTRAKCFDIPATDEVWIKFDVYFDGTNRWRAYNEGSNGTTGITAQTTPALSYFSNDKNVSPNGANITNTVQKNQLQTVLLHMVSGSSAGVVEAWVDGQFIYRYTGDVNHGENFSDIYLQSDGAGTFFSNVIISKGELSQADGYHNFSADVERSIKNLVEVIVDVQITDILPIVIPSIDEHFNHFIDFVALIKGEVEVQKFILPKKSKVCVRGDINTAIRVFSDTDSVGKITDRYAELDECNTVFIEVSPTNTPQQVIAELMYQLKECGGNKLDKAINQCTRGNIADTATLTANFMRDLNNSTSYTDFLREYCDIILDNDDTGAITGWDAGGYEVKTAESIVPEQTQVESWEVPAAGSETIIDGLTVKFPTFGVNGTLTDAEKFILAGLNSEWIKRSLDLIQESYGLNFYNRFVRVTTINVNFENSDREALAHVTHSSELGRTTKLSLVINMKYYKAINQTSEDGAASQIAGYLDRTIAHEFTHAVMAANIDDFSELPVYIKEGAAELVHGVDDRRIVAIRELLTTQRSDLENIFATGGTTADDDLPYAAGYMLLRYLAKQGRSSFADFFRDGFVIILDLVISDGNGTTRQNISADTSRKLILSVAVDNDVKIFDVIYVDFPADVNRGILAKFILMPIFDSPYHVTPALRLKKAPLLRDDSPIETGGSSSQGGSSSPFSITNSEGLQSMEISLHEQQLTDQLKVVGITEMEIMTPIQGHYLDYKCDMRAENVLRQGILYTADCYLNIDELFYTPLNYDMPNILYTEVTSSDTTTTTNYISVSLPVAASTHVQKFASALKLSPVMQFDDFYSSVNVTAQQVSGVTYNDLIREIFGWTARVPTLMINAYIRDGKLYVIQRGKETNRVDISKVEHTTPTFAHTLMRTYYQRQKFDKTYVSERKRRKNKPTAKSSEIDATSPDSVYEYDNDGLPKRTETTTTDSEGETVRTVTEYKYQTLESGKKVLVREVTKKYINDELDEETEIKHTPLKQGMSHQVKVDKDGDIIASGIGQNSSDDRVSPYAQSEDDDESETVTQRMHIVGLSLLDTSFPIQTQAEVDDSHWEGAMPASIAEAMASVDQSKGNERLAQITEAIKSLNLKTQETVTLSVYGLQHVIDFNDKIILDGKEYFLVSNTARTTPRILNEQNLILRRWY